ncbi:MAG: sialate O-acetylesterase [Bacteroidota bacterium]
MTARVSLLRSVLLLVAPVLLASSGLAQPLRLPHLFSDGLVIQRSAAVPAWGWATPGSAVTVQFDGAMHTTTAAADSTWRVILDPRPAGGPHTIIVRADGSADGATATVRNVLVGDVWIASGQSNMEWTVAESRDAAAEIAAADAPQIRQFDVPQSWAREPSYTLAGGAWTAATPEHVGAFTAVGYYFARTLRETALAGVPIGLLNTSWGGSRLEPWMSAAHLSLDSAGVAATYAEEEARLQELRDRLSARLGAVPTRDEGLVDGTAHWAVPSFDDGTWDTVPVPSTWEEAGYEEVDGVGWYRTTFDLTDTEAAAGVTLGLGMIDDTDRTWVNGTEVGGMEMAWNVERVYAVGPDALQAGTNVIAVRVEDFGGGGGIAGPPETVYLDTATGRRALDAAWRFTIGLVRLGGSSSKNQIPMLLWNKMVQPLTPFPVAGVIWYQGESNANSIADAEAYGDLFPAMIEGWRTAWGRDDLPFLWAQLASFLAPDDTPTESTWALLRESQSAALALPRTGQAILLDIGDAQDVHPRNKQDVGRRLALAARAVAYGETDLVHSGPVYRGHEVEGHRVRLAFDHVGGGLRTLGDTPRGFAIAGDDGRFVWANARIDGDAVVVWSDAVAEPTAVRYGWGYNPWGITPEGEGPGQATLYNAEGLPAAPFRTDGPGG